MNDKVLPTWFTGHAGAEVEQERCQLDDDQTTVELETCLEKGQEFIDMLLDHIRGNTRRRHKNLVCQSFSPFKRCLEPLLHNCAEVRHKLEDNWKLIYDVVNCACNNTTSCRRSLDCFVEQFKSPLGRQCDAVYRFNAKQGTNDRCHFLYENIRCKEALVESACSPEAGVFAFHVAKMSNHIHIRKHRCVIPRDREYHGFRYTAQCPSNLTVVMDQCEEEHIPKRIKFRTDFDLITKGGKKEVRRACKEYEAYQLCMNPLKESCSHGINKVYEFDGDMRRYLLKMAYICEEAKSEYINHLRCYRDLLDNDTLTQCNYIWEELSPMLTNLKAHSFYCVPDSDDSRRVQENLDRIRNCYRGSFDKSCGSGGEVIGNLMTKVFKDPVYLRYRFRPDCELHSGQPIVTGGPIPSRPQRPPGGRTPRPHPRVTQKPEVPVVDESQSLKSSSSSSWTSGHWSILTIATVLSSSLTVLHCRNLSS